MEDLALLVKVKVSKPCNNPNTSRCSTKVKYGKYNRKTKRYE